MRCVIILLVGLATFTAGMAGAAPASVPLASAGPATSPDTGTLAFRAVFSVRGQQVACPAGTRASVNCYPTVGSAIVPGLGTVSESYLYPVETNPEGCAAGLFRTLSDTVRFAVAGKGEIEIAVPGSTECLSGGQVYTHTSYPPLTIRGGTGAYAGASGNSTLEHAFRNTGPGLAAGTDTWVGTLSIPGLEFDVSRPILEGIVSKTVRAPRGARRARLTYTVTARDNVDGAVPVSCRPKSGSRFRIGRTVVNCSATDGSGNTATARFTITVKRRR
jgi:HYR domain